MTPWCLSSLIKLFKNNTWIISVRHQLQEFCVIICFISFIRTGAFERKIWYTTPHPHLLLVHLIHFTIFYYRRQSCVLCYLIDLLILNTYLISQFVNRWITYGASFLLGTHLWTSSTISLIGSFMTPFFCKVHFGYRSQFSKLYLSTDHTRLLETSGDPDLTSL